MNLGDFGTADKYLEKARASRKKIGDRTGGATDLGHLGIISYKRGEYDNAQEHFNKALAINMEIGKKEGVIVDYVNLGSCFQSLGNYETAEYFKKAIRLSKEIGHSFSEFRCFCSLTLKVCQMDFEKAFSYLFQSIEIFDRLRGSLKDNDQLKLTLLETHGAFPYKLLSTLLSSTAKPEDALYVEQLRRARGLADLMATQYSVTLQISGNPETWCGIQNIVTREANCACLYISVDEKSVRFWILKAKRGILFLKRKVSLDPSKLTGLVPGLDEFFSGSFRGLGILPEENCEDRSIEDTDSMSLDDENRASMRDDDNTKDITTKFHLCHKIIIAHVVDSCMYQVPFAALSEEGGKCLLETARIFIVPSLTTLKLIQESPPEYHSQRGALIVGDPEVGEVIYRGRRKTV